MDDRLYVTIVRAQMRKIGKTIQRKCEHVTGCSEDVLKVRYLRRVLHVERTQNLFHSKAERKS